MGFLNQHRGATRPLFVLFLAVIVVLIVAPFNLAQTDPDPEPPTTPPPTGRSPVITNQFAAARGGALQARRPGIQVQQGIAAATGTSEFIVGDAPVEPDFVPETIQLIILEIIDSISQIVSGLNLLAGGNPLSGLLGGNGDLGSLFNGLTGGNGSIPIQ